MSTNRLIQVIIAILSIHASTITYGNVTHEWNESAAKGEDYISPDGTYQTYKIPDNYPFIEQPQSFNVRVNGHNVGLYNDVNVKGAQINFGSFELKDGNEVEICITRDIPFDNFEILPHNNGAEDVKTLSKNTLSFTTRHTGQSLTFVFDGQYVDGSILHLFINEKPISEPKLSNSAYYYDKNKRTHYYGAGYHNLYDSIGGTLIIDANQSVYLAPGAVVYGGIKMSGTGDGKIFGHGMLVNTSGTLVTLDNADDVTIDGPLFHRHRERGWQMIINHCNNVSVKNAKILATLGGCTDGIDIVNTSNSRFDNLFVSANDDAIVIKGLCSDRKPNENLHFNNLRLWSYCNCGFNLGAETKTDYYRNISLTNSEVLWSYDDINFHLNRLIGDRGALSICCLDATTFENILFENIIVNHCEKFISLAFNDAFWFESLRGDQSQPGEIRNVTFRNVCSPNDLESPISNLIYLHGYDNPSHPEWPDKTIHHINFENVSIKEETLENINHKKFDINNRHNKTFVHSINFTKK